MTEDLIFNADVIIRPQNHSRKQHKKLIHIRFKIDHKFGNSMCPKVGLHIN